MFICVCISVIGDIDVEVWNRLDIDVSKPRFTVALSSVSVINAVSVVLNVSASWLVMNSACSVLIALIESGMIAGTTGGVYWMVLAMLLRVSNKEDKVAV